MTETKLRDKPTKVYRQGLISISVWEKKDLPANFTIQKSYKDGEGDWKFTNSLSLNDLHAVKLLTHKILCDGIKIFPE